MRVVNQNMIRLIRERKDGKASANTEVVNDGDGSHVLLFGKHIATYDHVKRELWVSDAGGWRTVTTKDRLNALLGAFAPAWRIVQKNHDWFVDSLIEDKRTLSFWTGEEVYS